MQQEQEREGSEWRISISLWREWNKTLSRSVSAEPSAIVQTPGSKTHEEKEEIANKVIIAYKAIIINEVLKLKHNVTLRPHSLTFTASAD